MKLVYIVKFTNASGQTMFTHGWGVEYASRSDMRVMDILDAPWMDDAARQAVSNNGGPDEWPICAEDVVLDAPDDVPAEVAAAFMRYMMRGDP